METVLIQRNEKYQQTGIAVYRNEAHARAESFVPRGTANMVNHPNRNQPRVTVKIERVVIKNDRTKYVVTNGDGMYLIDRRYYREADKTVSAAVLKNKLVVVPV